MLRHNALETTALDIADGVLDAIGRTPLIRLRRFLDRSDIDLLVKWEAANPGGSAKDRPAKRIIEQALARGDIDGQTTIIESSSGNMGIGLAQACRSYGLKFICVVDPRTQRQNLRLIEALGGHIHLVDKPVQGDFLTARIARVCRLLEEIPNSYWTNQYANQDNPQAHHDGTAEEIAEATDGELDVLLVATSSTGTIQGCRNYFRSEGLDVDVIGVDSAGSVLFGGAAGPRHISGLGAGKEPPLANGQRFGQIIRVTDLDCVIGCRRAAEREAILVGGSGGGVLMAVSQIADQLRGKRCVGILHDSGSRYVDTVFNDNWVERHLGCSSERLRDLVAGRCPTDQERLTV